MFFVEHFIFGPAGAAAFLAADFFLLLLPLALHPETSLFELIAQIAAGEKAV